MTKEVVTGPFDRSQWITMLQLKKWLRFYKDNNTDGKFNHSIDRDRKAYQEILKKAA